MVQLKEGRLLGPDVVPAGFIEGESKMSARNGFVVKDLAGAKKAVDWYADHGYPQIKIYNSFPKEVLRDTAAYAHQRGLRVSGHIPAFMRAQDAVEQGYDEIQHINQLMLNFFVDPADRHPHAGALLPGGQEDRRPRPRFQAGAGLHRAAGEKADRGRPDPGHLRVHPPARRRAVADHSPTWPTTCRRTSSAAARSPRWTSPTTPLRRCYTRSYDKLVEFVGRMYKAGVPIVAGTDELPGFTLQRELELYVKAGITPAQALQIATWNGAKYTRTLDDRGSITVGQARRPGAGRRRPDRRTSPTSARSRW